MTEIERQITDEIRRLGQVPFSRFMELALYCPVYGFYEKEADTIGRRGHFMTSVSVGPLFGELLAFTFADWIDRYFDQASKPLLAEAGAHDARLAVDILDWLTRHRPDLSERIAYVIIESSHRRRLWQADRLGSRAERVLWVDHVEDLQNVRGETGNSNRIIFSNEFLDAFPVHRLAWNREKARWEERGVTIENGRMAWCGMEIRDQEIIASLPRAENPLVEHLPDGYIVELSPAATKWWASAARVLHCGLLVACDYGLSEEDRLSPARTGGTLRAYHHHQCSDRVLELPGEQDLTAHVDFPEIIRTGEAAGMRTDHFQTQGRFLARLATAIPSTSSFAPPWDPSRIRQFATLAHPDHLGHTFKILIQRKE